METLALQAPMGASGDMLLGMLIDLGADRNTLEPIEDGLGVRYRTGQTDRAGVTAVNVTVEGAEATHRTPGEIREIIRDLDLGEAITARSLAIIDRLAAAEARVHGVEQEEVHFHEVGADDAIADICGVVALLDDLSSPSLLVTTVRTGKGTVQTSHGSYPIPPPAVTELAVGASWQLQEGPVDGELLTPTGAAILAELATGVDSLPPMHLGDVGYGAGDRTYPDRPNILRGLLGETRGRFSTDEVVLLETVIDDTTPEVIGSLQSTLLAEGARDVTVIPTTMKKSRPGHLVQVIVATGSAEAVARRLADETGTLGVREIPIRHRWAASRHIETVKLDIGGQLHKIDVKVATDDEGALVDVSAEYDDAIEIAELVDLPLREVCRRAEAVGYDRFE